MSSLLSRMPLSNLTFMCQFLSNFVLNRIKLGQIIKIRITFIFSLKKILKKRYSSKVSV